MHRKLPLPTVLSWIFIATVPARASAPAAGAADLVARLVIAANRGDGEAYLSGLSATSRTALTQSLVLRSSLLEKGRAFQRALDQRFGAGSPLLADPPGDLKSGLATLAAAEVLEEKVKSNGTAELRVKTSLHRAGASTESRDETLTLMQEGDAWKLVLGFAPDGERAARLEAALTRITEEVTTGRYPYRIAAMIAFRNAVSKRGGATQ